MREIGFMLFVASPWLAGIAWAWVRAPRLDEVPPSMGQRALERLRTI